MAKKTRRLLRGRKRKKTRRTRLRKGGAEDKSDWLADTKNFIVKEGHNTGDDGKFVDIYLKGFDNHGKRITEQHLMDEIYGKIQSMAQHVKSKSKKNDINDIYDGRNFVATVRAMKFRRTYAETYITPPLVLTDANREYNCSNNGKTLIMWSLRLGTTTDPDTSVPKEHDNLQGIDPVLYFKRCIEFLNKHYVKDFDYDNGIPRVIIPIEYAFGHSVCAIIDNPYNKGATIYLADPNGYRDNDVGKEGSSNRKIMAENKFVPKSMDYQMALLTESKNAGLEYGGQLLCDLSPQSLALEYVNSRGFCGGFTAYLCFFCMVNPWKDTSAIFKYISMREKQWTESKKHDWKKMSEKLWQEFEITDEETVRLLNPLNDPDVKDSKNPKEDYWRESNKWILGTASSGDLFYKGEAIKNREDYRAAMIKILGDDVPMDWFESHILMFLMFLEEYNEKYQPFEFYGIHQWDNNRKMLYDNGKPRRPKNKAGTAYEGIVGHAGVREYISAECSIDTFEKDSNKAMPSYNNVCLGISKEEYTEMAGRKPKTSTHNS